jgi:Leucine-rich repeat (LRR) protein
LLFGSSSLNSPPDTETEAATKLQRRGAWIVRDESLPGKPVISIDLTLPRLSDRDLLLLRAFPQLRGLKIAEAQRITDEAFAPLQSLRQLEELDISYVTPHITHALFRHLASLTGLRKLNLSLCSGVDDKAVASISGLTNLKWLDLHFTQVTDTGLAHLKGLTRLEYLNLEGTNATDNGLPQLKDLVRLEQLNLRKTKVTDRALRVLQHFPRLERLDLSETQVTDHGLVYLKSLPRLVTLRLRRVGILGEGLASLREIPTLRILDVSASVTESSLFHMKKLTQLRSLDISSAVTDTGLAHLAGLTQLEELYLREANATDAGLVVHHD